MGITPNEYESWRGSGCSLLVLLLELRRWLTRCRCQTHRGHWLHELPSLVPSSGHIWVPEPVVEWLDLLLRNLHTDAHLHKHVLVMHHKHLGDIGLDPKSLEFVLPPLRQQVVNVVLQLVLIFVVVGGDRLPCNISYCILVSVSESWTLMRAKHIRSLEDLHSCLVLFSSWTQNSLEVEWWCRCGLVDP
jgi:hypothetical protein